MKRSTATSLAMVILTITIVAVSTSQAGTESDTRSDTLEVYGFGKDRRIALRDAFRNAIEQGLGVQIRAETEVERFRLVKQKIFTEAKGYVETYEVLSEDPGHPEGYEIGIRAVVTEGKMTDLDNLRVMIGLMGNPSIMVHAMPASGSPPFGVDLVADRITSALDRAGYNMVAAPKAKIEIFRDALDLAEEADADVLIMATVHSAITGRTGDSSFPIVTSRSRATVEVAMVETGEIVYTTESSEGRGSGNTDQRSILKAIEGYIRPVTDDLLWRMAPNIGAPYSIEIAIAGIDCAKAAKLAEAMMHSADVESADFRSCNKTVGIYRIRIACSPADFAASVPGLLEAKPKVTGISRGRIDVSY